MNILVPLLPMGGETRNSLSGFSHGSVVSEWNPETSKAYLAITFALTHGILTNCHESSFNFHPFSCFVIQCLCGTPLLKTPVCLDVA